jgi:hypothetical protein
MELATHGFDIAPKRVDLCAFNITVLTRLV